MGGSNLKIRQEVFEQLTSILSLLDNLTEFLGNEVTNVIFFAIGRVLGDKIYDLCLLYTSPSPRDRG